MVSYGFHRGFMTWSRLFVYRLQFVAVGIWRKEGEYEKERDDEDSTKPDGVDIGIVTDDGYNDLVILWFTADDTPRAADLGPGGPTCLVERRGTGAGKRLLPGPTQRHEAYEAVGLWLWLHPYLGRIPVMRPWASWITSRLLQVI